MKEFLTGTVIGLILIIWINTIVIKDKLDEIKEAQVKCNQILKGGE